MKHLFLRLLFILVLFPSLSSAESLTSVLKDHKVGLQNGQGQIVVPARFEDARPISEKFVAVRLEGRWHLYNRQTEETLTAVYDKIEPVKRGDNLRFINVLQRGDWWILDAQTGLPFHDAPAKYEVHRETPHHLIRVVNHHLYGYLNQQGETVIPVKYDSIFLFEEKYYKVYLNKRCGVLNRQGEIVIPIEYHQVSAYPLANEVYVAITHDERHQLFNRDFEPIALVDEVMFQVGGDWLGVRVGEQWKIIEIRAGKVLARYDYELQEPLYDDKILFKQNDLYGIVNLRGKVLIPAKYDKLEVFETTDDDTILLGQIDNKQQLVSGRGKPLSALYKGFLSSFDSYAVGIFYRENRGLIDINGKEIAPPIYREIRNISQAYLLIDKNNQGKLIDYLGNPILSDSYDMNVTQFSHSEGRIIVKTKTTRFVIDEKTGKVLKEKL